MRQLLMGVVGKCFLPHLPNQACTGLYFILPVPLWMARLQYVNQENAGSRVSGYRALLCWLFRSTARTASSEKMKRMELTPRARM